MNSIIRWMAAAALCAALAAGGAAQEKEQPPAGGTPKPFTVPAKETFKLPNGMTVTLVPYGSLPMVTVSAQLAFGNANEKANQVWLADVMAELMKEGTQTMSAEQVAREAARMGGRLSTAVSVDQSEVSIEVLSEFATDAVNLVAGVLQRPKLPPAELERIRANMIRRLAVELSTPQALASEAFYKTVYGDHAYGRMFPKESDLQGYTIDDVRKFYAENIGARRTHLYVVGRFDPAIRKAITSAFSNWPAGPAVQRDPPKPAAEKSVMLIDRPDAAQSTLRIGLPVPVHPAHPDFIAFSVTNRILGGSFGSRITSNIREQKGYTYSPTSVLMTRYRTAHWVENADVTTNVTGESIKEILYEVDRMRKDPPTEKELAGIKNYMSGIFVLQNSSNNGIISQLSWVDLHGLSDDYLKTYVQRVNAVKREDVQRIAESHLDPEKMVIVVVGDKKKVEDSLKPYQVPKGTN